MRKDIKRVLLSEYIEDGRGSLSSLAKTFGVSKQAVYQWRERGLHLGIHKGAIYVVGIERTLYGYTFIDPTRFAVGEGPK